MAEYFPRQQERRGERDGRGGSPTPTKAGRSRPSTCSQTHCPWPHNYTDPTASQATTETPVRKHMQATAAVGVKRGAFAKESACHPCQQTRHLSCANPSPTHPPHRRRGCLFLPPFFSLALYAVRYGLSSDVPREAMRQINGYATRATMCGGAPRAVR